MKIGIVTNLMDSNGSGIGRYTSNLVENLLKIDKKNQYVLIHSNKKSYDFKGNYKEIQLPFFTSIPKKLITGLFILKKMCEQEKLDIVHDTGQIGPYFTRSKTKKILTIFDLSVFHYPQAFGKVCRFYSKFLPTISNKVDRIITISESSKRDIKRFLKVPLKKISVTYLGVEKHFKPIKDKTKLEKIRKKFSLPPQFILFVGTIEPRKNIPFLIMAFARARLSLGKNIKLIIGGKMGWEKKIIYTLPEKFGIKKYVSFLGEINENDLPSLYNLATTFVYPSLYEGFGLPVLEAMACGCPVITSKVSSLPEIVGKAAILIDPYKEADLALVIENIIINNQLRKSLTRRGLTQVKKFSWERCARETLNLYQSLK